MHDRLRRKLHKTGKRLLAGAGAALASIALALSLLAPAQPETPDAPPAAPPAIVAVVSDVEPPSGPDADALPGEKRRSRRERLRLGALSAARWLGTFLLTLIARFLTFLGTALIARLLGAPIATLAAFLGDVLITFLILLLLFALLFKALFPDRKLRTFFTRSNLLVMLAASVLLALFKALLPRLLPDSYAAYTVALALLSCAVYAGTWRLMLRAVRKSDARAGVLAGKALSARMTRRFIAVLLAGTLTLALLRVLLYRAGSLSGYAECAMLFLVCAAVCLTVLAAARHLRRRAASDPKTALTAAG